MKAYIHAKCRHLAEIIVIPNNLNKDEILIHFDYSEKYKCQHQKEIQIFYFGNKTFSLFTAYTY